MRTVEEDRMRYSLGPAVTVYTIQGRGSLRRAIQWTRFLVSKGYTHKIDWDWHYHPSQQEEHKRAEFWFKDGRLLTIVLLCR